MNHITIQQAIAAVIKSKKQTTIYDDLVSYLELRIRTSGNAYWYIRKGLNSRIVQKNLDHIKKCPLTMQEFKQKLYPDFRPKKVCKIPILSHL